MDPLSEVDPRWIGAYRLQARLGSGGMGRVYLAFSPGGRATAVKVIHPELARDQAFAGRFRREVAAARQVSGAYTAPVIDASGDAEDPPWLATAFVPGPSLADVVAALGPLPQESLWRLAAGLAEALTVIHSHGLVHRDLKPLNVLLATDGPRVIDFGISRALDATTATTTGLIVGSPSFMSPEQAEGMPVGPASDVFSLGCVLAHAAIGNGPFGAGTPASIIYRIVHTQPSLDGISGPIRDLISSCLAKDPAQRATLSELMDVITAQLASAPPALSFWPSELADWIGAYQAQLASELPSAASSGPDLAAPSSLREPTAVVQPQPITESTITAHRASLLPAASPDEPAEPTAQPAASSPGKSRRNAVLAGAAGFLVILGLITVGLVANGKNPSPAPTPTLAAAAHSSTSAAPAPVTGQPQTVMPKDGLYVVGVDIKPGVYRTTGASPSGGGTCFYFLLSSTNTNDIIDSNSVTGPATITVGGKVKAVNIQGCNPWQKSG